MKTVNFKPGLKPNAAADDWVTGGGTEAPASATAATPSATPATRPPRPERMKRFTIDVPASLHSRIKIECARRGVKMADELRALLEREFPR